jgi:hypothetical protein
MVYISVHDMRIYYLGPEAGHILYLRMLYPIHIQAPKKDIISYLYHGKKKDMDIYPISFCQNFCQHFHIF